MNERGAIVGVDVGGTFTDLFLLDGEAGRFRTAKVPSYRGDEALGFLNGLKALGGVAATGSIVHGTTVATNTLLERRGPKIGVITTRGFRDVLEMRRRDRPRTWGLWGDFVPIADRDFRIEVDERTLADGTIRTPVDVVEIRAAAKRLLEKGAHSLAVIFINAYANPDNERRALVELRAIWPNEWVTASHAVLSEIREFERASTTALNAYLQPVVASYLGKLQSALASQSFSGRLNIVQSNGGIMSTATARMLPVRTALSGPAAGVIAAAALAKAAGFDNLITCDLGGTSFDVSVVADGKVSVAAQTTIDFGLVIRTPMIEITTIGAGGGSIASVDRSGLLQVGPESAGSVPGPACYGQGNRRPTLTDAQVVLGRINAARPLGGELRSLDVAAAREAIATHVGKPLDLDDIGAAAAIVRVAEARMAGAIRLVSIERGHNPSRFVAMPFGGGGALHVAALIRQIGLKSALVPRFPGITSALGCVLADVRHDVVQTLNLMLDGLNAPALAARMRVAAEAARAVIAGSGIAVEGIDVHYVFDMHYLGQTHTVAATLEHLSRDEEPRVSEEVMRSAFEAAYRASFSRLLPDIPIRIVTLRVAAIGRRRALNFSVFAPRASASLDKARRGARSVWFDGGWCDTSIWARLDLPTGAIINGPAILEQPDATTVIDPGFAGRVDSIGNVIVEPDLRTSDGGKPPR
jgi:N-methylhydantoinase A